MKNLSHTSLKLSRKIVAAVSAVGILGASWGVFLVPDVEAAFRPGYNGKIVYSSWAVDNTEVFLMNLDGGNKQRITTANGMDGRAVWSPDGEKIAFLSTRDGNSEIYVMNADGSGQTNITNHAGIDNYPVWSPDGSKIAFTSNRESGVYHLFTVNPDGSELVKVSTVRSQPQPRYWKWSHDGNHIAYSSSGPANIYTVEPDGTNHTQITTVGDRWIVGWLPDDLGVYYTTTGDNGYDLFAQNLDGSNVRTISDTAEYGEDFIGISPDGSRLAVVLWDSGWDLNRYAVMDMNGDNVQVFDFSSSGVASIDQIQWAPDGKKLLLTAYHEASWDTSDLYTVDVDGANLTQITNDDSSGYGDWQSIPNASPTTTNDSLATAYNTTGIADVLSNDTDEEFLLGANLTIATAPLNGTAVVENGKVKYTPNDGFKGSDQLTYQICDAFVLDQKCATGVLGISVQAPGAPALNVSKVADVNFDSTTNKYTTSNKRPTFSGTASAGAEIKVEIHSDPILLTAAADSEGIWSVAPTQDLPTGEHEVFISATLNGVTTELDSFVLSITDEIPNTGASTWPLRVGGVGLMVLGCYLYWRNRRRINELLYAVPDLFVS